MKQVEILLVEDNENDAELAIRALLKNNFTHTIEHMKDGPAALDFLFARGSYTQRVNLECPKLILLDLKLPKINGLEVLKEIRQHPKTKRIPVIMLTSSREEKDVEKAYQLGANSYIVKPVEFDIFIDTMQAIGQYWMSINQAPLSK